MNKLNISENIFRHRKRIGYTQQDLADFLNISKSAVSKWERGNALPEVNYLGELGILFDISIDELVGFSPWLTKQQIRIIYTDLAAKFSAENYDAVLKEVKDYAKRYYSCYPFLTSLAGLLVNHLSLTEDKEETIACIGELIERILSNSDSLHLKEQMIFFKALLLIKENSHKEVIELLKESTLPKLPVRTVLAQSYLMNGEAEKAKSALHIEIYESVIFMMGDLTMLVYFGMEDDIESVISKGTAIDHAFNLKKLHPNTALNFYLTAAMKTSDVKEKSMFYLKEFLISVKNLSADYYLHGDDFFSEIDDWIEDFELGKEVPVNKTIAKEQLIAAVEHNESFKDYKDDITFKNILHSLKLYLEAD